MSINWIFEGSNSIFHVVFPNPFWALLFSPVYWPVTHPWASVLTLHPPSGPAPLTQASSSARLRPLITNSSSQATGLSAPIQAFTHHKQTPCCYSRQVFFFQLFFFTVPLPTRQNIYFSSFILSFLFYPKWEEKKWRKWWAPFCLHFSILSYLLFSCSPLACVWVGGCVFLPHGWASA